MGFFDIGFEVGFLQETIRADFLVDEFGGTVENVSKNAAVDVVGVGVVGLVDACDVAIEKEFRTAQVAVDVGGGEGEF